MERILFMATHAMHPERGWYLAETPRQAIHYRPTEIEPLYVMRQCSLALHYRSLSHSLRVCYDNKAHHQDCHECLPMRQCIPTRKMRMSLSDMAERGGTPLFCTTSRRDIVQQLHSANQLARSSLGYHFLLRRCDC